MEDSEKTRDALISELAAMRRRADALEAEVAELKAEAGRRDGDLRPRAPRERLAADIELIADCDVIEARGINVSDTGICFEIKHDLPFEMQYEFGGEKRRQRAHLVWIKRLTDGGYRLGLKFVTPTPYPEF